MFTGIIEETGVVQTVQKAARSSKLTVSGGLIFRDLKIGDSVAVNGVCLTAAGISGNTFTADVMHETLRRSALGVLKPGSRVNLERAMPADGRFGGHIVSGHIDGTGEIIQTEKDDNAVRYSIRTSRAVLKYIVEKGSVAIDGISLTVAQTGAETFCVSVIPHTIKATTLSEKTVGDKVNLENDIIGKYIEKLIQYERPLGGQGGVTDEFLAKHGYR